MQYELTLSGNEVLKRCFQYLYYGSEDIKRNTDAAAKVAKAFIGEFDELVIGASDSDFVIEQTLKHVLGYNPVVVDKDTFTTVFNVNEEYEISALKDAEYDEFKSR